MSEYTDGLKLFKVKKGYIAPFTTIDVDLYFSTSFPGKFAENYIIKFEDPSSQEVIPHFDNILNFYLA